MQTDFDSLLRQAVEVATEKGDAASLAVIVSALERAEALTRKRAFDVAAAAAKADIGTIIKRHVGANRAKYADMLDISTEVEPALREHGLSYRYRGGDSSPGTIKVVCVLTHKDGHSEETALTMPADAGPNRSAGQAIGSASTYGQRYSLMMALGLATARDDDGRLAGAQSESFLSDEQVDEIADTMRRMGFTRGRAKEFLGIYGVDDIADLPAARYRDAIAKLAELRRKSEGDA